MDERYQRTYPHSHIPIPWPALIYDDASGTWNWTVAGTGGDDVHQYATAAAFANTKGIHIQTRATNPAEADYLSIVRNLWVPSTGLLRLQLCFKLIDAMTNGDILFRIYRYNGTQLLTYMIKCLYSDESAQYYDSDGAFQTLTGLTWSKATPVWNKLDWSINTRDNLYHRITLNHAHYDMSSISPKVDVDSSTPRITLSIRIETTAASDTGYHLDNILLTPENP